MNIMTYNRDGKIRPGGFTLIEATLALAIGTVLLASLFMIFKIGKASWNTSTEQSELIQHARVAMDRLSYELRYAKGLNQADTNAIEFPTTVLINSDDTNTETVRYEIITATLQRSVDGGTKQIIAGSTSGNLVSAYLSLVQPLKLDASNNLIALTVSDPLSLAVALLVEIKMKNTNNMSQQVVLRTMVNLRDK